MAPKHKRKGDLTKVLDEKIAVRCPSGSKGNARFETWVDEQGKMVKYNMALIHHLICQSDNGRVLGYDNAHGYHERHFMNQASPTPFVSFEQTTATFLADIDGFKVAN